MVYQGSKNKLAKYLKPIIESYLKEGMMYVEPFVGGANMIDKIDWPAKIGLDVNEYLIALHIKAKEGPLPVLDDSRESYNFCRSMYNLCKANKPTKDKPADWVIGYYGFLMSYNGRFFDGGYGVWSGKVNRFHKNLNNLNKQAATEGYKNIMFGVEDFRRLSITGSVVYLDPPYANTKQYGNKKFNHNELWEKCKQWKEEGNIILLSELDAPSELWECIWEQEHSYSLRDGNNKNKKVVEKLFIYKGE